MQVPWTSGRTSRVVVRPHRRWSVVASGCDPRLGAHGGRFIGRRVVVERELRPVKPTKALCKKSSYKIGYDVFSGTQPFANLVTKGLYDAAKQLGCVTIVKTVDNLNGPVAVGNLKTLLNQKIDGFVDFQVLAPFQPAISKLLKGASIPGVAIVGADLPGLALGRRRQLRRLGPRRPLPRGRREAALPGRRALRRRGGRAFGRRDRDAAVLRRGRRHQADLQEPAARPHHPGQERRHRGGHVQQRRLRALADPERRRRAHDRRQRRGHARSVQGGRRAAPQELPRELVRRRPVRSRSRSARIARTTSARSTCCPESWGSSALAVILAQINGTSFPKAVGIKGKQVNAKSPETGCK